MINRSKIKNKLKKVLPKPVFNALLASWQKVFIKLVGMLDVIRLKKFTTYHSVKLTHQNKIFSLFISPKNGFVDERIYLYGVYEPAILDLIAKDLKEGGTFVDIGANIGHHSMFAASVVGNTGKVYSFEPIPRIYNQLLDSVHLNKFDNIVKAYNFALGEKDEVKNLYLEPKNIGGSSLVEARGRNEKIEVKIAKGDDTLLNLNKIDLIKIDVEGYEYEVLSGIKDSLTKYKPAIILEFSGEFYKNRTDDHGDKIISLLQNLKYSIFDIEDAMEEIISKKDFLEPFTLNRAQTDLFCLPKN